MLMLWGIRGSLSPRKAATGNGTLATVTFSVEAEGEGAPKIYNATLYTQSEMGLQAVPHKVAHGYFKWTVLGDIDGDGNVDIFDVVAIALIFGAEIGDNNWDSRADLNNDGSIDILDVVIVAGNYGRGKAG